LIGIAKTWTEAMSSRPGTSAAGIQAFSAAASTGAQNWLGQSGSWSFRPL
jgi:hypothetical protein